LANKDLELAKKDLALARKETQHAQAVHSGYAKLLEHIIRDRRR
jgi:hypothetical protein